MIVQCLYQNDPENNDSVWQQRNACRRAANKLGWQIGQERISDAPAGMPLLMWPDVQAVLRDLEQGNFQILLIASVEYLRCPQGEWEGLLQILRAGQAKVFAAQRGRWLEPGGRNWPPLPAPDWTRLREE